VARTLHRSNDEIDSIAAVPHYPLRSNPRVVLVSPLHTPPRRHCIKPSEPLKAEQGFEQGDKNAKSSKDLSRATGMEDARDGVGSRSSTTRSSVSGVGDTREAVRRGRRGVTGRRGQQEGVTM
jgi:hypothetical protein